MHGYGRGMGRTGLRPSEWTVALAVGGVTAAFLWQVAPVLSALSIPTAVAVLYARRIPSTAVIVLALLLPVYYLGQVPPENPAALAPGVLTLYYLGRYSTLTRGILGTVLYLCATLTVTGMTIGNIIFGFLIFGGAMAFGRTVCTRAADSNRAQVSATELESTDITGLIAQMLEDERARIGGQALAAIRASVATMQRDARLAHANLDPTMIAQIAEQGRATIHELRWLLGLLRADPEPQIEAKVHSRVWLRDVGIVVILQVLTVLDGQIPGQPPISVGSWILLIALPTTLLVRRTRGEVAVLSAALIILLLNDPLFMGSGVGPLVTLTLLSWNTALAGTRAHWAALLVLSVVVLLPVVATEPENIAITVAILWLPAFAGHEWSAHARFERAARLRADAVTHEITEEVDRAVRQERARIARELHDVTSHAVGVMVLQAGAASALRRTDPNAARASLLTVQSIGTQALAELSALFELMQAGVVGAAGLAGSEPDSLKSLVSRMRLAGLAVELDGDLDCRGLMGAAAYRVIQEGLTNAARYAPAANILVKVSADHERLNVAVTNSWSGPNRTVTQVGSGFGLAGLSERVRSIGGTFLAGRTADGFAVHASFPLPSPIIIEVEPEASS